MKIEFIRRRDQTVLLRAHSSQFPYLPFVGETVVIEDRDNHPVPHKVVEVRWCIEHRNTDESIIKVFVNH